MQRNKNINKINDKGEFQTFEGVTVISKIHPSSHLLLSTLLSNLSCISSLESHFSLLPMSSLHMTTNNLYVAADKNNWNRFINSNLNFFQSLAILLKQNNYLLTATIEDIIILENAVIQLTLTLPSNLKTEIQQTARFFGIADGIPNEFHITLAYQYKPLSKYELDKLQSLLRNQLTYILSQFSSHEVSLNTPSLCFFKNMQEFIEWDGKCNPFSPPPTQHSSLFTTCLPCFPANNKRPHSDLPQDDSHDNNEPNKKKGCFSRK